MRLVGESYAIGGRKPCANAQGTRAEGGKEGKKGRKGNAPEGGHILQGRGSPLSNGRNTNHAPVRGS